MIDASDYNFDEVETVLFAPAPATRRTVREALNSVGFRAIKDYLDIEQAREAIVTYNPDLLICDLDQSQNAVCSVIGDIRHGKIGSNPFMIIMLLTWDPQVNAVNFAMQTGVDDIIMMPISVRLLQQRVDKMIRSRKRFVATEDYVGPERRAYASREEEEANSSNNFEVTNSLRHKATGDEAAAAHKDMINYTRQIINQHRLTELTTQVSALATQAKNEARRLNGENDPTKTLIEVRRFLDQISSHVDAQGNDNLIILADSMHRVVNAIGQNDDPTHDLWDILVLSGQAMSAILWDRAGASELVISALDHAMAAISVEDR
jgi:DNA-binding response OmpR family regulator